MRLTRLRPAGRRAGYVVLEAEGVRLGALPIEEIAALDLALGEEIDGAREARLVTALERVKAYDAAVRLLAVRARSVQEVISRLRRKGLRPDAVDHAVGRLETEGLLDDAVMSRDFARSRLDRGYGRSRILAELSRRGVGRREAERAVAEAGADRDESDETALLALAEKRAAVLRGMEPGAARRRLAAYLARRGYAGGDVWDVVDRVLAGHAASDGSEEDPA